MEEKLVITYSHSLVFVFDEAAEKDLDFKEAHFEQGFARADSTVAFFMLTPWAKARLRVVDGAYSDHEEFDRVIQVPLYLPSGSCRIRGPENKGVSVNVNAGHYKLAFAQKLLDDEFAELGEVIIALFFEQMSTPLRFSSILVRDPELVTEEIYEGE